MLLKVLYTHNMDDKQKHLQDLSEIRSIMERSSSFISLSGLSGIFSGIIALGGAAFAYWKIYIQHNSYQQIYAAEYANLNMELIPILLADAAIVLALALAFGFFFTYRNTQRKGLDIWDNSAKNVLENLLIPLATGGIFCAILLWKGYFFIIAPATLIFYGLALLNASKYTLHDIRYLGLSEIAIGLISTVFPGYSLSFWALGFGVLHIIYGTVMYFKYEMESNKQAGF